ncbi:MAG: protein kinase domain-containing protein [Chthoniobacterales bacterium]
MATATSEIVRCAQCGAPLIDPTGEAGCANCLLGAGLDEFVISDRRFQHYEICLRADGAIADELGRGAMGITYRARDINLDAPVALKVISENYARSPEARERFRREARAAAQLRHPNVARVFHFGETESGQCFYVMELIEGETLEAKVRRDGPLPPVVAVDIAMQICRALIGAEAQGLVHRDLKPSNVMLTREGEENLVAKVIDFGLAKPTADPGVDAPPTFRFSGTPGFASPEQLAGDSRQIDTRSDIYSLGATLWYVLSGAAPFSAVEADHVRSEQYQLLPLDHLSDKKIPPLLLELLRSTLSPDPAARPQTARELLVRLRDCEKAIARKPPRGKLLAAATIVIALALLAAFELKNHSRPEIPPPEKSIAVLPFQNLSDAKEDAFFAAGVQDQILSDLARIADLKVISRTSVMRYQTNAPRNVGEIGRSLGVANILEGSVQRIGQRVRVTAQLIDVRHDTHLWSETYDRDLSAIFAIQDEIAQQIAQQLQARIAPPVQATIAEKPTSDLTAYAFYERALEFKILTRADHEARILLLRQAIERDPNFILAYCKLGKSYSRLYEDQVKASEEGREATAQLARETVATALRLRPDRGEPHLAQANYCFATFNFPEARKELEVALRLLPNDSEAIFMAARLDRHENRWDDAVVKARRAAELDPHNKYFVVWIAESYLVMRRYPEGEKFITQAEARNPSSVPALDAELARFKLAEGDLAGSSRIARESGTQLGFETQFFATLFSRDYFAALQLVATARPEFVTETFDGTSPNSQAEAMVLRARGEREKAAEIYRGLRQAMDKRTSPPRGMGRTTRPAATSTPP